MRLSRAEVPVGTLWCVGLTFAAALGAAVPTAEDGAHAEAEMIVTGKALEDLRLRIEVAENEVYARFSDINSNDDYDLRAALMRVGQAKLALEAVTGSRSDWTLDHDVRPGADGLPFGAQRVVEVRIGEVEWNHTLTAHTFTITGVHGRIRDLHLKCDNHDSKLAYKEGVDWTIPPEWGACALRVDAKRETMFALYEFE